MDFPIARPQIPSGHIENRPKNSNLKPNRTSDNTSAWASAVDIGNDFMSSFTDVFNVLFPVAGQEPKGIDNRPLRIKMDGTAYLDEP